MEQQKEMTEQQAEEMLRDFMDKKHNQHSFFTDVIKSEDTTKTGNLTDEELGEPRLPLRSSKELELICKELIDNPTWATYFEKEAEILTSTSLSKDAKLITLAVTNKKELADVSPKPKKENKGWFRRGTNN